jgi:hypothetical protein
VLAKNPYHIRLDGFDLAKTEARACDSVREHEPHRPTLVGEPVITRIGLYAPRRAPGKEEGGGLA